MRSLEIDVKSTIWVQVSQELRSSLSLDETITIHIEVVESILNRHSIDLPGVSHALMGAFDLGGEGLGVLQVKHHNTSEFSLDFDFSGVGLDYGLHKFIVSLLGKSVWHNSLIASMSIGLIHVSWNLTVVVAVL